MKIFPSIGKWMTSATMLVCFVACQYNNVKIDPAIEHLIQSRSLEGGFMWMDNARGEFTVSNVQTDTTRVHAGGSSVLLYALEGLERGNLNKTSDPLKGYAISIDSVCAQPTTAHIQLLYQSVDSTKAQALMESIHYGNQEVPRGKTSLSVDEQVGFVKKLYFNQLPISSRTSSAIKASLQSHASTTFKNCRLVCFAPQEDEQSRIAWQMGWMECNKEVYFFALYLQEKEAGNVPEAKGKEVLNAILEHIHNAK